MVFLKILSGTLCYLCVTLCNFFKNYHAKIRKEDAKGAKMYYIYDEINLRKNFPQ
jgi:hypothetical protein